MRNFENLILFRNELKRIVSNVLLVKRCSNFGVDDIEHV